MSIRACILVPVYNHPHQVDGLCRSAQLHGLDIVFVDDGSNAETVAALEAAQATYPELHLLRHERNMGKGRAVMSGLRWATEHRFTHAVQLDADGQHDLAQIPEFLESATTHPDALILGQPLFDESVPKIRFYGRYITHACVWLETFSFAIKDSMCGFRVYPLEPMQRLMRPGQLGDRMDFDTEVAVRLCWLGVPVINLPTKVRYATDQVSHFRMVRDNLRLIRMHTALICQAPFRLLRRARRRDDPDVKHWNHIQERGAFWCMRFMLFSYRIAGRGMCMFLVFFVVAYFFLTSRTSQRSSYGYLQRVYEAGGLEQPPTWRDSFRLCQEFGRSVVDKFSSWMGDVKRHQCDWPGKQVLLDHVANKEGIMLLGAHLGNIEVLRAIVEDRPDLKVNAMVLLDNAEQINRLLEMANPRVADSLVSVKSFSIATALKVKERVDAGQWAAILGDRVPAGATHRVSRVPFLGSPAAFPQGPFILASVLECPVYFIVCLRDGPDRYRVHFERLSERIVLPREGREQALEEEVTKYAAALERVVLEEPYQWFNFFDFWDQGSVEVKANTRPSIDANNETE